MRRDLVVKELPVSFTGLWCQIAVALFMIWPRRAAFAALKARLAANPSTETHDALAFAAMHWPRVVTMLLRRVRYGALPARRLSV